MATQKFRPVLTAEQIDHIIKCVSPESPIGISIIKQLIPFQAKISIGAITPSYSISPESEKKRIDLEERARYNDGLMTPEEESRYEREILGI
jgi:hypothetical protein